MYQTIARLFFGVCVALLSALPAQAASQYAPGLSWQTIRTDHFLIHYHDGLERTARDFAVIAEQAHTRQTKRLNWTPKRPTHVVIADMTDGANGYATPIPYNKIVLNATAPDGNTELLLNTRNWRELLMVHEYTHILHMDRAADLPRQLRGIFGRHPLLFPNIYNPTWMVEGLATYEETSATGQGRGVGSFAGGLLQTQAAAGKFVPFDQAGNPIHRWPNGAAPYLYGVGFLRYLADQYGDDVVERLVAAYSDNIIPFMIDGNMWKVTGKQVHTHWNRWRDQLKAQAGQHPGRAMGTRLTRTGFGTGSARLSPDGTTLAWSESTPDDHPRIMLQGPDGPARELAWRTGGGDLAWLDDTTLLVAQPEVFENFKVFFDLYRFDTATGHSERLTRGARVREPDVGPDGQIVAVVNGMNGGGTALVLLDNARANPTPLLMPDDGSRYATPRFSPDGATVAVAITHNGKRDLFLVDVTSGAQRRITDDDALDAHPAWGPMGRYVVFSSDRTGRFNLFAWDAARGDTYQITDVAGAALAPEIVGETIVYTGLSADGFDLYEIPFDPTAWHPAPASTRGPGTPLPARQVAISEPRPYRPYPAALPRFWLPVSYVQGASSFYGAFTFGSDPLEHHVYTLQAARDFSKHRNEASLLYKYDRFYPTIQLLAQQNDVDEVPFLNGTTYLVERQVLLDVRFPINHIESSQALFIGLEWNDFRPSCDNCTLVGGGGIPAENTTPYLRLGAIHDSRKRYGNGISPVDGQRLQFTVERALPGWGTPIEGTAAALDWRGDLALPGRHQVLAARLTGATSTGSVPLYLGGKPRITENAFDRTFAMRGYAPTSFIGKRLVRGTLSYRFPLAHPEKGFGTIPMFLDKLHGNLFAEGAQIRANGIKGHGWKQALSAGAELGTDLAIGYQLPLTLRLGVAHGLGDRGETRGYLLVETPALF